MFSPPKSSNVSASHWATHTPELMQRPTSPPPTAWKKYRCEEMVITELHLEQILGKDTYAVKGTGQEYLSHSAARHNRSCNTQQVKNAHSEYATHPCPHNARLSPVREC